MKCESCPNRPCDEKKAACDNCVQRQQKKELEGVLTLSFRSFLMELKQEAKEAKNASTASAISGTWKEREVSEDA